ncbi:hypothetical protein P3T37_003208 [Kitasatospora sp. MAA4]|uniref:hypothetical protein n=1 Tax=Kitasatospora sp. MAA4 TaxID=3035093 RepID=UPI002474B379|nr:hypothetical protein [Kitasatospora sp. MAA4]MDH6133810.1 hypothetical protein [Kitasatospora sp. MAA4]
MAAAEPHNPYAAADWRLPEPSTPSPRRRVLALGSACALPSLTSVALGSAVPYLDGTGVQDLLASARVMLTLATAIPALFFALHALRPSGPRRRWLLAPALIAVALAATGALGHLLPFRPGLLSVLVFALPSFALAGAAVLRSRAALLTAAGLLLGVFALALPLRAAQQEIGVQDLLIGTGIPSRSLLQPITSPGVEVTGLSSQGRQAVFVFSDQQDLDDGSGGFSSAFEKAAVETISPGYSDPCNRPLLSADGERLTTSPLTPCFPEPGGLWSDGASQYVLQRDGLTITLSAAPNLSTLHGHVAPAILSTHPVTDPELRTLEGWFPYSWLGVLLL